MTRKAAIIGSGVIGGGWAARFLLNGWDVAVFDPSPDARARMERVLADARYALPMLYDRPLPVEGTLAVADTLADAVAGAAWIQESVPERLDLKHQVLAQIEAAALSQAFIGSSTSGFKPSELRVDAAEPGRIVVAHPFNPVYLLPLVEIVGAAGAAQDRVATILRGIGMEPLFVRREIDAHIADRLLEAVWREALWLVKDGVATTEEIDNAIRYGFGLRWAQMGLFETYRVAGGDAGMRHFMAQFGPALKWPWTKLMDVPDFTDELVELIATQSDAQSGHVTIAELERRRDENLVAILRALKARDMAAGALLNAHEGAAPVPGGAGPLLTIDRTVPIDWTDYNGHMNESRYGQVFSDAADAMMRVVGADAAYIASGLSFFTVDIHIKFLREMQAGVRFTVRSHVLEGAGKKLRLSHRMCDDAGETVAMAEQLLIHVSLETRRSCDPVPEVAARIAEMATSAGLRGA